MKRDLGQAKERLRKTYRSLTKHDLDAQGKLGAWGWLPKSVFNLELSSRAYGLLVMLSMHSAPNPAVDNRRVVERVRESTILRWLGLSNSNQKSLVHDLLAELEEAEIIMTGDDYVELTFPAIGDVKEGFCKVYTSTYKAILEQSHGIAILNRLAVYLGIRSYTYEGETGGPHERVVYEGRANSIIGEMVDLPTATVRNVIRWFIDNEIMAWNLVQNRNKYHNTLLDG